MRKELVNVLAGVLNEICNNNDQIIETTNITPVTYFHALKAPEITIKSFLKRIEEKRCCSEQVFVVALIYIDRLLMSNHYFILNSLSVHRVIITSIMIGAKLFDEPVISNAYFAFVGYLSCREINMLEIDFLFRINFDLTVGPSLYDTYSGRLVLHAYATEKEFDCDMNTVFDHELNGQEEYQLEQDASVPKPESAAHSFPPDETKEMDTNHMQDVSQLTDMK